MAESITITTPPAAADKPVVADPNRPAWLPEKFKNPEEMAAAYSELEKKQTTAPAAADLTSTDAAKTALAAQGLDITKLTTEYTANGKLSADSMAALSAKGFSEAQVKQFIDGQEAIARENTKGVFDSVGGKDRFDKLMQFAKTELTVSEQNAYDAAARSGDFAAVKIMLAGINTKFEARYGKDANLTQGNPPAGIVDAYESFADYRNALRDPRYKTDPHYRSKVDAKLERSSWVTGAISSRKGV